MDFELVSRFQPTGDQPRAIAELSQGLRKGVKNQTLLGVTGSGKTFTISNVIQQTQLPTLIISHNKTLAGQLYQEFRDFFPNNAVSYFVSYYDYYQPEAYMPTTDTYIAKETQINDDIDKLRLATTTNLLTRKDVIVVASVSCIYNLGSPIEYAKNTLRVMAGELIPRQTLFLQLSNLQYQRTEMDLSRATYRVRGETIQIWPAYQDTAVELAMLGNQIEAIREIDPLTGFDLHPGEPVKHYTLFPAKHYVADPVSKGDAVKDIEKDLFQRVEELKQNGKSLEAFRLEQRVRYDLDMIREVGFVNGIENYSRYFDGRKPGDPPFSLLDHFQENARQFGDGSYLTVIDESHITIPQIRGMYNGDQARKKTLVDYGFRLPSALDNRPLKFEEFLRSVDDALYVSATPADWELSMSEGHVAEQLIRPTGLVDPEVEVRPTTGQVQNLAEEVVRRKSRGERVLVTTLTKRMAEALTEYLNDPAEIKKLLPEGVDFPKVQYLHADVETLDRSDILDDLRRGVYDVIVGINLLREGLDLPEVSLVAILDADKEGFLRSDTSLIQTMGRAARHAEGRVILYADKITDSMKRAMEEVERRREVQQEYNRVHGITPKTIQKPIREQMIVRVKDDAESGYSTERKRAKLTLSKGESIALDELRTESLTPQEKQRYIRSLNRQMNAAAKVMDFELAAVLRDALAKLQNE